MNHNGWDCVGDLHSCYTEFTELIEQLGYGKVYGGNWFHPEGRRLALLGDFLDRGPEPVKTIKLVMELVNCGIAVAVSGNHCNKLERYLRDDLAGDKIKVKVGKNLSRTLEGLNKEESVNPGFKKQVYEFLHNLPFVFETEDLICCHAAYIRTDKIKVQKEFALYGETSKDQPKDAGGYPIRGSDWKKRYTGLKTIVHGHIIEDSPNIVKTKSGAYILGIDLGCCHGGYLCAYRHGFDKPEFSMVKAKEIYCDRKRELE